MTVDRVELQNISVDCVVGTRPDERLRTQAVTVSLAASVDARKAAASCRLRDTLDYAALYAAVQFIIGTGRFLLLETAAEAVARYMLISSPELVREATVSIIKPHIMPTPTLPRVTLTRTASDVFTISRRTSFGSVAVVQESSDAGIYLLTIAAQQSIASHCLENSSEHTMTVTAGLSLQGKSVPSCYAVNWPAHSPRRWKNTTAQPQQILCVNRPACDPTTAKQHSASATLTEVEGTVLYPY